MPRLFDLSRRSALAGCLAAGVARARPARASDPLPVAEAAEGLFVHDGERALASPANQGAIANVGFVVGGEAAAVIDSGGSFAQGVRLRAALRRVTGKPIRYLITTHVHPDHIFGHAAFLPDRPEVVGHAKLGQALAERGDFYLETLRRDLGRAADGSRVVPPTAAVASERTIDLGDRRLVLRAHRPAHTDNDLSVFDEATSTFWAADLVFLERLPVVDGSLLGWLDRLDEIERIEAARVVPGHGPASAPWPAATADIRRYLSGLRDQVRALIADGGTIDEAVASVGRGEAGRWTLFDAFHQRNVLTAYAELEWE